MPNFFIFRTIYRLVSSAQKSYLSMENEPFLQDHRRASQSSQQDDVDNSLTAFNTAQHPRFFICIFALKFCVQFTAGLLELPIIRLIERAVCRDYVDDVAANAGEAACKIPVVQDKLAFVMGYKWAFDSLPCLLTALFYGPLANSHGRRFVLAIVVTGQLLALCWIMLVCFPAKSVPVEGVWLSSMFLFIGGGGRLELSMIYTTFSDAVPWDKRTRALFFLHAATHSARLVGPPVGSLLMNNHLWAPFTLAVAALFARYILLWFLPETSPYLRLPDIDRAASKDRDEAIPPAHASMRIQRVEAFKNWPKELWCAARNSKVWKFLQHKELVAIFTCFIVKRIGFTSENLAFQYASEILHKPLYQTVWLRVLSALGATLTLSVFLPLITQFFALKSPGKDVWVIRGSLIDIVIGFLVQWQGKDFITLCIGGSKSYLPKVLTYYSRKAWQSVALEKASRQVFSHLAHLLLGKQITPRCLLL